MAAPQKIPNNKTSPLSARGLALTALDIWEKSVPGEKKPLDSMAESLLVEHKNISSKDRGLFRAILFGVIRYKLLLDFYLDKFLEKPEGIPLLVRNSLRIALFQIIFLDRVPDSAAVNESVKLIKKSHLRWAAGLANAVLRKITEIEKTKGLQNRFCKPELFKKRAEFLSVVTSHPLWLVVRWKERLGITETEKLCHANNEQAPLSIRINNTYWKRDEAEKAFNDAGIKVIPSRYSPSGLLVEDYHQSPEKLPGFKEGGLQVQDEASQLVSFMLDPGSGMKILDFCAGAGGKTTHISSLAGNKSEIIATDKNSNRLKMLQSNIKRLSIKNVKIVPFSFFLKERKKWQGCFDRVLVDAPCSGFGVIRRRPDIKWNRQLDDIKRLTKLQGDILKTAAETCKPGGIMVYAVCTREPEETVDVVKSFLSNHKEWRCLNAAELLPENAAAFVKEGFLSTTPKERGPDGFFAAALTRNS